MQDVPSAVQPRGVLAELKQDLLHLERGGERLDQHGSADGSVLHADVRLREVEDIVPEPRFLVVLHFGEVEVRARAARDELFLAIVKLLRPFLHNYFAGLHRILFVGRVEIEV